MTNAARKPVRALHDPIRLHLAQIIEAAARGLSAPLGAAKDPPGAADAAAAHGGAQALDARAFYEALVEPPKSAPGAERADLALGCFVLAKALRLNPAQAAAQLARRLSPDGVLLKAAAAGPYLNLTLATEALGRMAVAPILDGSAFRRPLLLAAPRTMVEYSQPNTHKEIHVGHMRNLCFGDAIVRLQRYAGVDVVSSTFPGDVGTHVAKALWYFKYRNREPVPETERGEWLGKLYSRGHLALEDEAGSEKEADNREKLTMILKQLEAKQGEFYELWKTTRAWSIELMEEVYAWAGAAFDRWYWESDVDSASVELARRLYAEGKLQLSEGAIGMDLSAEGLGFCLLLKSDGTGLYATKDLELARRKFDEMKIEKSLYVVDMRQALHFKQVFKVLEKLGFEQARDCAHLQYNFVELPDGAMSSRKGNIVPLMELVARMEAFVKDRYLSRYRPSAADLSAATPGAAAPGAAAPGAAAPGGSGGDWSAAEIESTAADVARGAIKYGMLRMDSNKKIVFEMEEWLKLDGESGPFIQYSHARVASLCRKLGWDPTAAKPDWSLLGEPAERNLERALMGFNTVALGAAELFKPSLLCGYLYDLAKVFNVFYHECPIGAASSPELRRARLALAAATGEALARGLGLLGIPAPQRM
jgi:arginyl-tRNA synthetase